MAAESHEAKVKEPLQYLLLRPDPTLDYKAQASQDPSTLTSPRPLLIVLDLNRTLIYRVPKGRLRFICRRYLNEFLDYLFYNHHVMVWSSAQPANVEGMCKGIFSKAQMDRLVAIWTRDDSRLGEYYNTNVQVYKQLSWVWEDGNIQSTHSRSWSQADTVLIDDSKEKAVSEPHSIIELDEFEGRPEQMEVDMLGQVVGYLEILRSQKDVSAYMRSKPFVLSSQQT